MGSKKNRRIRILLEELQECTVYLYGAGKRGKVAYENLYSLGFGDNIIGFLDDNYNGRSEYCGKPLYSLEDIHNTDNQNNVYIITTYSVGVMVCNLLGKGISVDRIYFLPELLIDDYTVDIFRSNSNKIEQVYNLLNDHLSKYIYKSLFDIYLQGNIGILSRTRGDTQYFPEKGANDAIEGFSLTENETFIDCGAYDGDTIRQFAKRVNGNYKKVWAFEPDTDNFMKLSEYVDKEQDKRIQLYKAGVFDIDSSMSFDSSRGTSSALSRNGETNVKVYRLDSVIQEKVTFIKMDIEGSEKGALLGAENILLKYKPKLAICIYHKVEDLWEIPLLIKSINPEYKIYVRNYEDRIDETVCYAI